MKNIRNNVQETSPGLITIDSDSIYGNKFARAYTNELSGNIYDLFNDLNDKQLSSIIRRAKKYNQKNTTLMCFYMRDAFIGIPGFILQQRKERKKQ